MHRARGTLELENIRRLLCGLMHHAERQVLLLRHRTRKQIALHLVAVAGAQEGKLLLGFNALGNGFHVQAVRKDENALQYNALLLILTVVAEQGFIDFEHIRRDVLHELQGGQSAAEIINRHGKSRIPDRGDPAEQRFLIADHC